MESVPTIILLSHGKVADAVVGADVPAVTAAINAFAQRSDGPSSSFSANRAANTGGANTSANTSGNTGQAQPKSQESLELRLKKLTHTHPVMLFMKGTPTEPRCGFSRQTIELLESLKVDYVTFNILADEEVRQGLKTFSNWPTYPQLYVFIVSQNVSKWAESNRIQSNQMEMGVGMESADLAVGSRWDGG